MSESASPSAASAELEAVAAERLPVVVETGPRFAMRDLVVEKMRGHPFLTWYEEKEQPMKAVLKAGKNQSTSCRRFSRQCGEGKAIQHGSIWM